MREIYILMGWFSGEWEPLGAFSDHRKARRAREEAGKWDKYDFVTLRSVDLHSSVYEWWQREAPENTLKKED